MGQIGSKPCVDVDTKDCAEERDKGKGFAATDLSKDGARTCACDCPADAKESTAEDDTFMKRFGGDFDRVARGVFDFKVANKGER